MNETDKSEEEHDVDAIEPWDDNYGEDYNSTEEAVVPKEKRKWKAEVKKEKRKWKPEEKEKVKEKEVGEIVKSNLKYQNKELIDKVDDIAIQVLKESGHNKHRDHFFPIMIEKLGYKTGAEIGVDKGEFSLHILSKTKMEKYYCIDTWQDNFGSDCKPGFYDKDGNKRYNAALSVLGEYVQSNRAVMLRMTSMEASTRVEDNSLDFVYIDGDHSLEMLFDLYYWLPKIRIGGMISGHDLKNGPRSGINNYWGKQLDYQVKLCVEYYCDRYGFKMNPVGGRILSWWFVRNR